MANMFKEGWALFVSSMIGDGSTQKFITTENGEEWGITEHWCEENRHMIHEINLEKLHYLKTFYYAELEIRPLYFESLYNVYKSTRQLSSEIQLKIGEEEYRSCFRINVRLASKKRRKIWIKIKLTPILPLSDLPSYSKVKTEASSSAREPTFEEETPSTLKKIRKIKRSKGFLLKGIKGLSHHIFSLLNDKTSADVILHCGPKTIHAHRNILCARSSYFSAMFLPNSEEHPGHSSNEDYSSESDTDDSKSQEDPNIELDMSIANKDEFSKRRFVPKPKPNSDGRYEVRLNDIDPSAFQDFLNYLYGRLLEVLDFDKLKSLLLAAYDYGVEDLKLKCVEDLKLLTYEGNTLDVFHLWQQCRNDELKKEVLYFCEMNRDLARNSSEIREFLSSVRNERIRDENIPGE